MGDLHMHMEKRAIEQELVARLWSNEDVSLEDQERAQLRSRIKELNRRLAMLNGARGKLHGAGPSSGSRRAGVELLGQ